jgi:phosphatidate cytidylyltransferase
MMITEPVVLWLAGGAAALLVAATLIGAMLARRVASPAAYETVRNLNARIRSWWVMVALFAAYPFTSPALTAQHGEFA